MPKPLPHDEIKFGRNVCLKEILNTPDDSDIGYFLEVDSRKLDELRQTTKHFTFVPEIIIKSEDDFNDHMTKIKPKN